MGRGEIQEVGKVKTWVGVFASFARVGGRVVVDADLHYYCDE
jgi:hypothetical protein